MEITSGGQRVHDYDELVRKIKEKLPDIDPEKEFGFYLQAFKYGMPPHGGMGAWVGATYCKNTWVGECERGGYFPAGSE